MYRINSLLFLAFFALRAVPAFAWGLSTELNESWAQARLVFPALQQKTIRYCIKNEVVARFDSDSIALQVEAALRLWLEPLKAQGVDGVAVERVPCEAGNFNLLVQIGEETEWKTLGSYQLSSWDDTHYYSLVKLDSTFLSQIGGKGYPIADFKEYAGSLADEAALIRDSSREHPQTVPAFAAAHHLDPYAVFWSTFPSLLHELGHSFGLCDTYDAPVKDQCDPKYSSQANPSSVMKDSNYLYLTGDDVTAIKALFARYRN